MLRTSQYEDTDIVEMQSLLEKKDLVYILTNIWMHSMKNKTFQISDGTDPAVNM